jgi:transposase
VEGTLQLDPFSNHLFVFCNRKRDKVKCLYWETNGFCLWYKRLEKQRFHWPTHLGTEVIALTGQQLNWLLDGFDLRHWRPHQALQYQTVL